MKQALVFAVVVAFTFGSCGSVPPAGIGNPNPGTGSLVAFPTHPEPTSGHNMALLQGKLIVSGGCLRIGPGYGPGDTVLIYWPYGYSYRDTTEGISVFDGRGRFVATVGDYLSLAGGEYRDDITGGRCKGPTWNAGSVDPAPGLAP